ncbi:methyltransferase family protein [Celeribacter indicus]|uniref:S-isoprenylcysteine methyltransferase-like protein n=1 Tax=Celeribacter indicus TaxID=1208324 RepID=A0A0B5DXB0_9RHOB|nr:isoprenylcysteine carboxylmethyltransferase family protein [Celeribacter indicus]AJE45720.1 S-isoprenylcysteine methyltransferase-like protein [Celeribacter indicus]SDX31699.1 Protein-S-isoprenylcysteine O-methyltransferase Ste14 [Celeribacter indicus]
MPSAMGWAAFAALSFYLILFALGTMRLASSEQRVWLFATAQGRERLAAFGFRAAFVLAFLGPLLWMALPLLHKTDPLWSETGLPLLGAAGASLAWLGTGLALLAQSGMGASWRVGVQSGQAGALVTTGLFGLSRNPTFLGQAMVLAGMALAVPCLPTLVAPVLMVWSASIQIRSEESVLLATHGESYARYMARVPRWIGFVKGQRT